MLGWNAYVGGLGPARGSQEHSVMERSRRDAARCSRADLSAHAEELSAWLAKAEAQLPEGHAERLLLARLAPDMFPLATQVRFACVQAQEGVFRLQ